MIIIKIKNRIKRVICYIKGNYYKFACSRPKIKSIEDTIREINLNKYSVGRYGDGELDIMVGKDIPFQKYNIDLANKMKTILKTNNEEFLVTLPDAFGNLEQYTNEAKVYWKRNMLKNRKKWDMLLQLEKQYYNTSISRFYMDYVDKSGCVDIINELKKIWDLKNILIIEGEKSRLGIGNDLFDNANSIRRILCPAVDAYSKYKEILEYSCSVMDVDLYLIALGPTATVLAYDLHICGKQAIDIGHIDVEYEWYLMGAKKKVAIKNKYVNEVPDGRYVTECNDWEYNSQIIKIIM